MLVRFRNVSVCASVSDLFKFKFPCVGLCDCCRVLILQANQFTGSIPDSITSLTQLSYVTIKQCQCVEYS